MLGFLPPPLERWGAGLFSLLVISVTVKSYFASSKFSILELKKEYFRTLSFCRQPTCMSWSAGFDLRVDLDCWFRLTLFRRHNNRLLSFLVSAEQWHYIFSRFLSHENNIFLTILISSKDFKYILYLFFLKCISVNFPFCNMLTLFF